MLPSYAEAAVPQPQPLPQSRDSNSQGFGPGTGLSLQKLTAATDLHALLGDQQYLLSAAHDQQAANAEASFLGQDYGKLMSVPEREEAKWLPSAAAQTIGDGIAGLAPNCQTSLDFSVHGGRTEPYYGRMNDDASGFSNGAYQGHLSEDYTLASSGLEPGTESLGLSDSMEVADRERRQSENEDERKLQKRAKKREASKRRYHLQQQRLADLESTVANSERRNKELQENLESLLAEQHKLAVREMELVKAQRQAQNELEELRKKAA